MVATSAPLLEHRAPRGADQAALTAVCLAPVLGIAAKMSNPGWVVAALIVVSPIALGLIVWGIVMFVRALGPRSVVRPRRGAVPSRYRIAAWAWAAGIVLPFVVVLDGGDSAPWESVLTRVFGLGPEPDWYYAFQGPGIIVGVVTVVTINILMTGWLRHRSVS